MKAIAMAVVLTFTATAANAGIIVSDRAGIIVSDKAAGCTSREGIIVSDRAGIIVSDRAGLIIAGIAAAVTAIADLVDGKEGQCGGPTSEGLIIAG